ARQWHCEGEGSPAHVAVEEAWIVHVAPQPAGRGLDGPVAGVEGALHSYLDADISPRVAQEPALDGVLLARQIVARQGVAEQRLLLVETLDGLRGFGRASHELQATAGLREPPLRASWPAARRELPSSPAGPRAYLRVGRRRS